MQIHEQPHVPERDDSSEHPLTGQHAVPAPVASVAHVSEAVDEWNPIVPDNTTWTPRGRRATHRANGKH
jgi:hypothetical protein